MKPGIPKSTHKRIILDIGYKELGFWELVPVFKQAAIEQEFEGFDIEKEFTNINRDDYYRLKALMERFIEWKDLNSA